MFLEIDDIRTYAGRRQIIFWGCSEDWIPKSKRLFPEVTSILDINCKNIGKEYMNLSVLEPGPILNSDDIYIVITTGSYASVENRLLDTGFIAGKDFAYSPVFKEYQKASEICNASFSLMITASDYTNNGRQRSSLLGGGLYKLSVSPSQQIGFDKLISGSYRQVTTAIQYPNCLACIEYVKNEVHIWSLEANKIISKHALNLRHYTGITNDDSYYYVVSSAYDVVQIYDKSFNFVDQFAPIGEGSVNGESLYHLNDIECHEGKLYIGCFSKTGSWRLEHFDGGILVCEASKFINNTSECFTQNLFQPHSPRLINGTLHFCESPKGILHSSSWSELGKFSGFIRGLDYKNGYYSVGQSETLYLHRSANFIPTCMNNSGIYLFDSNNKVCRFYPTYGIQNIHDVRFID